MTEEEIMTDREHAAKVAHRAYLEWINTDIDDLPDVEHVGELVVGRLEDEGYEVRRAKAVTP